MEKQPTALVVDHISLPMPGEGWQAYNDLSDMIQHGRIRTVFQPVISLKFAKVYGYEALSRTIFWKTSHSSLLSGTKA